MSKNKNTIIYLLKKMYNISKEDKKTLEIMLDKLSEEEINEIAFDLRKKYQKEKKLAKTLLQKIKKLINSVKEFRSKKEADNILLKI